MAADHQKLLPKPSGVASGAGALSPRPSINLMSKRKVGVACRPCQTKRAKCDGARPQCAACIQTDSECKYATKEGQSHADAKKQKIAELEKDKVAMFEILWHLQTKSPEESSDLLQHLRSVQGGDIGAMLNYVPDGRSQPWTPPKDETDNMPGSSAEVLDYPQSPYLQSAGTDETICFVGAPAGHDLSIQGARAALDMFFLCVGSLFYVFDKPDVDLTVESITAFADLTLADLVSKSESLKTKTLAAELAGMIAMGIVHLNLKMPEVAPAMEVADFYYTVARHGLDSAIRYDPLRAMKLCVLLAFYNITVHATVALAYIELGISLARNHGINSKQDSSGMSSEFIEHKRTFQTLVHLQCWLSASFNFIPGSLESSLELIVDDEEAAPLFLLQRRAVKVTIIKAAILHSPLEKIMLTETVAELRAKLTSFHKDMPKWMSLGQLLNDAEDSLSEDLRGIIFYVHMFYMSAMMLLSRRLIITYVPLDSTGKVHVPWESSQAIEEGFTAAKMAARVVDLMLIDKSVVQTCWLCIFTSYTACIMSLYCATQKALSGLRPSSWSEELELVAKCLRVLAYCAEKDRLAGVFRTNLVKLAAVLRNYNHSGGTADITPPLSDILFTTHSGTSPLHATARHLLLLMHRPFHGVQEPPLQSTLKNCMETALGVHVEWHWEIKGGACATDCAAKDTAQDEVQLSEAPLQVGGAGWTTWTSMVNMNL